MSYLAITAEGTNKTFFFQVDGENPQEEIEMAVSDVENKFMANEIIESKEQVQTFEAETKEELKEKLDKNYEDSSNRS